MAEYRRSAHAVFDLKYHLVWITKYRYKILKGRLAERARDLIRQTCQARGVVIVRGAVSPDHIHMLVSAPPELTPAKMVQYIYQGAVVAAVTGGVSGAAEALLGATVCGREGTSVRRWGRWTRRRFGSTSRIRNGMRMKKGSRSPCRRSLEPAVSRTSLRRLQPHSRLSVAPNLPALAGSILVRSSFSGLDPRGPVLHHRQRRVDFVPRRNKRQKPLAVGGNIVAGSANNRSEQRLDFRFLGGICG